MEKVCFCCKQTKQIAEFYPHKAMKDGYLNKCIDCTKEYERNRRQNPKFREKILAYDRARGNRHPKEYLGNYRTKYPNKYKAHNLVNNYLRLGKIERKPCCVCGKTETLHAHHNDYLKPLEIVWMCSAHHKQWHAKHGEAKNP